MRIAFIIHSMGIGGMEKVMLHLVNEFSTYEKVELHLILMGRRREIKYSLPTNVLVHIPSWKFNNKFRFFHTIKTIIFVRRKLISINPHGVLSFGEIWNNLVLIASRFLKLRVFVSDRSIPGKNLGMVHNFLRNQLYPLACGFIAQTEKSAKIAKENKWNNNIQIIGNPVKEFNSSTHVPRKRNVLTVGRLIKTKKIDRLIEIFAHANSLKNWKLLIVGGNSNNLQLLHEYNLYVENEKLQNEIFLLGEQENVNSFYSEAEIFAFTSISEGFPNVLAEAMSAGCACIAYDCNAGPSDIIDDDVNGFLIPLENEKLFEEKLIQLMNNANLRARFSVAAIEKMKEFNAKKIAKQYFNFITQRLENNY